MDVGHPQRKLGDARVALMYQQLRDYKLKAPVTRALY
jgi:hypothetical protein